MSKTNDTLTIYILLTILGLAVITTITYNINQDQEIEHLNKLIKIGDIQVIVLSDALEEFKIRLDENRRYNKFQEALNKIDKNDYSDDYNCYEFTKELQQELLKLDIFSVIAITEDRTHSYLLVGVEATEGRFLEVDNGYEIMEIRNSDLEVIELRVKK